MSTKIGRDTLRKPLLLLILDGWGHRKEKEYNAVKMARTPNWIRLLKNSPHTLLNASGSFVGLPQDQVGNSEVGHMHIGAGHVIESDYVRINQAITSGTFFTNPVLLKMLEKLKQSKRTLHIIGLVSKGGVHSDEEHLFALLKLCQHEQFTNIVIHAFLDGRDTPPTSGYESIKLLEEKLKALPGAFIGSLSGRFYALDRDNRWEDRIQPVYDLLTGGTAAPHYSTASDAIVAHYQKNISDEFVPPTRIGEGKVIEDDDIVLFINYRTDRPRQLTEAFISPEFSAFQRKKSPKLADFLTMTQYSENLKTTVVFPAKNIEHTLGECVSNAGLSQLRIAETEKFAHVTFFLNGGRDLPFPGEERLLINSPKVNTYDLKPEMSAYEVTNALTDALRTKAYALIIANLANADMVGHAEEIRRNDSPIATIRAIECIDNCLGMILKALEEIDGVALITADHGNAEIMYDEKTGQPHKAHTMNPVPFVYVGSSKKHLSKSYEKRSLIDIAPTLLELLDLSKPEVMKGNSLFVSPDRRHQLKKREAEIQAIHDIENRETSITPPK